MRQFEQHRSGRRGGFTLVELLVVITIIAILMGLVGSAVIKALGAGDDLKARNEITQLANAVQAFKTKTGVSFVASGLVAKTRYAVTDPNLQYLKSVWPRIGTVVVAGAVDINWGALQPVVAAAGNTGVALDGNQCLVLFFAGVDGVSGLSDDSTNPFGGSNPKALYEFALDRLQPQSNSAFKRFLDPYGSPYVYFSSGAAGNDYAGSVVVNGVTMVPFLRAPGKFVNPTGFQIASAGKDAKFGGGGTAWAGYAGGATTTVDGADDIANFAKSKLGIPDN